VIDAGSTRGPAKQAHRMAVIGHGYESVRSTATRIRGRLPPSAPLWRRASNLTPFVLLCRAAVKSPHRAHILERGRHRAGRPPISGPRRWPPSWATAASVRSAPHGSS